MMVLKILIKVKIKDLKQDLPKDNSTHNYGVDLKILQKRYEGNNVERLDRKILIL